jgi:hypothetical protein
MLLGVRTDVQRGLHSEGFSVRAHVPFRGAPVASTASRAGDHPAEAVHLGEA